MMNDEPTPKQNAVLCMAQMFRAKISACIEEDFEGWVGTMKSDGYEVDVEITVTKRRSDS